MGTPRPRTHWNWVWKPQFTNIKHLVESKAHRIDSVYMSYYYLSRGKSRQNQPQAMNSNLGEQGSVLNSHLGRSFIIVSGVSNFQPKGILVLISTRLHNLWQSISQLSVSFSNLLKRGNSSYPIEQWNSNSGRYQNHQGNLVKI